VDRKDAVLVQMLQIDPETFVGQEVDGDGIAAERVDGQDIEALRLVEFELVLEDDTTVTFKYSDVCAALVRISEEREPVSGPANNHGIEFVKAHVVGDSRLVGSGAGRFRPVRIDAGVSVRGQRSDAEADDPDPELTVFPGTPCISRYP